MNGYMTQQDKIVIAILALSAAAIIPIVALITTRVKARIRKHKDDPP